MAHSERAAAGREGGGRLLVVALCAAVFLLSALQTLVVPLVSDIGRALDVSAGTAGWVVTANLLAAAVCTPLLGRFGDRVERKTVLLGILIAVLAGSLLAASTRNFALLIVGRVLQGASYGIFPVVAGIVRQEVPSDRAHAVMACVSGMLAVGGGVALVATGLLTHGGGDYRRVFWLSAIGTALCLVLAWFAVPSRRDRTDGRADWWGALLLAAALLLLLTPLSQGIQWGWASSAVVGCLTGAAVAFALFVLVQRRTADPLIGMRMLTYRPLAVANLVGLALGACLFVVFLGVSSLAETPRALAGYGFTASVLSTSVVYVLPGSLSGIVAAPLGGLAIGRFGSRNTLVVAMAMAAASCLALAFLHAQTWEVIVGVVVAMMAIVCGYAATPALLAEHVGVAETGLANGINSICRSVGSALASAMMATLLTKNTIPGLPMPQEGQFTLAFTAAAATTLAVALVVALGLPRDRRGSGIVAAGAPGSPAVVPAAGTAPSGERPN